MPGHAPARPLLNWPDTRTTAPASGTPTLTVKSGSGSRQYAAGTIVTVTADPPPPGKEFAGWSGDTQILANPSEATTSATIPSIDVTITATYANVPSGEQPKQQTDHRHFQTLRRAVDLDNVSVGIEEEELGETGRAVATDHDTHRVVLRRVFAKTVGSQRGEGAIEIIGAESKMAIGAVDVAGPEGAGRINGQMHLQGAAGEPIADALEGRPFHDCEAEQLLIEGERPREIGDDDINVMKRKLSHGRR